MLSHYFDPRHGEEITALAATDWLDILSIYPQDAIEHACRSYLQSQPSKRPTPADIRNRAVAWMDSKKPRTNHQKPEEPRGPRVTPEAAKRILEENGFTEGRLSADRLAKRFTERKTTLKPEQYLTPDEMRAMK